MAGGAAMSRLIIMTIPELTTGYQLGGATTVEVTSTDEAQTRLEELLSIEDGVIAVHAPYYNQFPAPLRRRLDHLRTPLVVALPAGSTPEHAEERRDRLLELLRQAVGYGITFGHEGTKP
jgi:vacuolar-type H+-ATPase subunit F/Vma7